jgi:fumarate reductase iron-sulfur subunit
MRTLRVKVFRKPSGKNTISYYDIFTIEEKPRMSVLMLLDEIRDTKDSSLYYEAVCRSSICGSCAIKINGKPMLACKTQTSGLPEDIKMEPLAVFPHIKDLGVDKAVFFEKLNQKLETWVHRDTPFENKDEIISDELSSRLYDTERCIECGICISACPAASFAGFIGATGSSKGLRFALDPRNENKEARNKLLETLTSDEGLWGCHGVGACENFCPKEIPLINQLASARKEILALVLGDWSRKFINML